MSTTETPRTPAPIMLRARITEKEWAEIRKTAIDAGLRHADFVAVLLRAGLAKWKEQA